MQTSHVKTINFRQRSSNMWFDDECRNSKIRVRSLERKYRSSNDVIDRIVWINSLKALHKLYNSKKASITVDLINSNMNNPRALWQTLNSTLGLSQKQQDFHHTAHHG